MIGGQLNLTESCIAYYIYYNFTHNKSDNTIKWNTLLHCLVDRIYKFKFFTNMDTHKENYNKITSDNLDYKKFYPNIDISKEICDLINQNLKDIYKKLNVFKQKFI